MNTIIRALGTLMALGLAGSTLLAEPAPASHSDQATPISAELAKTCRALDDGVPVPDIARATYGEK
jgi:hypothetical protein